jgi:hypothetical protein
MKGVPERHHAMKKVRWGSSFRVWMEVGACYSAAEEPEGVGEASSLEDESYRLVSGQRQKAYGSEECCHQPQIVSIRSTAAYHD